MSCYDFLKGLPDRHEDEHQALEREQSYHVQEIPSYRRVVIVTKKHHCV